MKPLASIQSLSVCRKASVVCLLLAAITLVTYWPVTCHPFINLDDQDYITDNLPVKSGLSWSGVVWAFQSGHASNWHPLTWVSHMLDCQLYGLNPGGHHLTNLLLHTANSLLLFLLLYRLTGVMGRSAVVAALFAWHPLHVESVAWASERKDVLSTFFFLLTLWAYARYAKGVERRNQERGTLSRFAQPPPPAFDYLLALLLFALGLMAKPMLVTLPCVLLLIDFWPLGRLRWSGGGRILQGAQPNLPKSSAEDFREAWAQSLAGLLREKLPFFALSLGVSIVTFLAQRGGGAVSSLAAVPLHLRIANALVSYWRYIGKTVWPADLAMPYPYPEQWPIGAVIGALVLLVACLVLVLWQARYYPYLAVGWCWFLGTLVPVIGLVQVGPQAMADRYMYIPSIGLFILVVWGLWELTAAFLNARRLLMGAGTAALLGCVAGTATQVNYWQNGVTLFQHTLEITTNNYVACDWLGKAFEDAGQQDKALACFTESVRLVPHYAEGRYNLGTLLLKQGDLNSAVGHLTDAVTSHPNFVQAQMNLGEALLKQGRGEEALSHFARAVQLNRDGWRAHYNFGTALLVQSKVDEAAAELSEAVRLNPSHGGAHRNLAVAFIRQGQAVEALAHFSEAVRLDPANPDMRLNYGLALLEQKKPAEAATQFGEAVRLRPLDAWAHYRWAEARVQTGQFSDARAAAQKAHDLALAAGQQELADKAGELLKLCSSEPSSR